MRYALVLALVLLNIWPNQAAAVERFELGGSKPWSTWTGQNTMVDDFTDPSVLQPRELKPNENLLPQLGPWYRWKFPPATQFRPGNPRIWRGINYLRPRAEPREFVDGDPDTFTATRDLSPASQEFYTIDLGTQVPLERFAFFPPEGNDPFLQEPYRPNFAFEHFELSASNDVRRVAEEEGDPGGSPYQPLDIILVNRNLNVEAVVNLSFPLRYLRFLRIRFFPDASRFKKFALEELEAYGRGFPPEATWESKVIDLGQVVNFGPLHFTARYLRRENEILVPAPSAPVLNEIKVKTGLDETPTRYHSYNDIGQLVEVTESQYDRLKQRVWPWDPPAVGWRGPISDDPDKWGFWSPPIRTSGQWPRVTRGRFLQIRVAFKTETLWDFARLDSLAIEFSPLLAEQVLGEVAVIDELRPPGRLAQVPAGVKTELVCDLRAEFADSTQQGFDAVRLLLPSEFLGLEMGQPPIAVEPDNVVVEPEGLVIYLPQPVRSGGIRTLRLRLATTLYSAASELQAEVFARADARLPQLVEAGDASQALDTNQLQIVTTDQSLGSVLADMQVQPPAFTPQGDGINDQVAISYTLFRILNNAEVGIKIFALNGQRIWTRDPETRGAGRHQVLWNGLNDRGQRVVPGVYVARIEVETDKGYFAQVRNLAISY